MRNYYQTLGCFIVIGTWLWTGSTEVGRAAQLGGRRRANVGASGNARSNIGTAPQVRVPLNQPQVTAPVIRGSQSVGPIVVQPRIDARTAVPAVPAVDPNRPIQGNVQTRLKPSIQLPVPNQLPLSGSTSVGNLNRIAPNGRIVGSGGVRGDIRVNPQSPAIMGNFNLGNRIVPLAGQNYLPSYRNYGWYNGYWNPYGSYGLGGPYGQYGAYNQYGSGLGIGPLGLLGNLAFGYPLGWGLGGWGLGRNYYASGYLPYANPYYTGGNTIVYNYSQPIPVATDRSNYVADQSRAVFDSARRLFLQGNYSGSLDLVDDAIRQSPSDAVLHEFRALVLFAQGDYDSAAATLHSLLSVGPGWDWPTMVRLYPNVDVYTKQLRTLESFVSDNPRQPAPRFVLAYHYITIAQNEAAEKQLREVTRIVPHDRTAADLLAMLSRATKNTGGPASDATAGALRGTSSLETHPIISEAVAKPFDVNAIHGTWNANRSDGSQFHLQLSPDKSFTWQYSHGDQKQTLSGSYATEGSLLILEPSQGGTLIGRVSLDDPNGFNFRMLGSTNDDPGLSFTH